MDKEQIESFLSIAYPGHKKFMDGFITPLFDGKGVTDYRGAPYPLDTELKSLAGRGGIREIRLCADVNADYASLKVFDVTVRDNVTLRRNRVTVQQLVRRLAKGGNALMAFHHAGGEEEWRLSFYQDFAGHETSAKRHTFLVGPGQNMRTITTNFLALHTTLLANGGLEDKDFVACFDAEALSKEFFAKYKAHYEKFCAYVTSSEDTGAKRLFALFGKDGKRVRDYVKKMMGRLVFLQFLQKKGWMGVPAGGKWGEGDKNFLQALFKKATAKQRGDFLDAVLEPLFFQALNTDRTRTGDVFDTGVAAYGENGKVRIPYLNGGLFTNDNEDNFRSVFPAAFFSNPEFQDDPDPAKCGLLDFFAQYNFTIDENDPTEAEVGVDPEMLSCIFENLLEDNKDKGAFYTPKAIVEYMCRQSLTAYLQAGETEEDKPAIADFVSTHEAWETSSLPIDREGMRGGCLSQPLQSRLLAKLKAVRICDPAIGSGAFPMGLLRELVFCRSALGDPQADNPAELKKEIIESNIYGVDIEKGAVDIARLRFWLSLVVDEDSPLPLPNLDFKIMQGNSLLESYKGLDLSYLTGRTATPGGVQVTLFENEIDLDRKRLRALMRSYYECHDPDKKRRMRDEIRNLVARQVEGNWATDGRESAVGRELKEKILRVLPKRGGEELENLYLFGNSDFFPWHLWFADVFDNGGFDIVIGNPPYVSSQSQMANDILRDQRKILASNGTFKTLYQKWDLYIPFMELATQLCRKQGITSMIVPFPLTNQIYAREMRRFLVDENEIIELVDLNGTKIFENATVSNCIVLVRKPVISPLSRPQKIERVSSRITTVEDSRPSSIWISHIDESRHISRVFRQPLTELVQDDKTLVWNTTQEKRETNRHADMHVLGDYCYVSYGLRPNSDEKTAKWQFKKEDLISDVQDAIPRRKYIEAKDIARYVIYKIRFLEYGTTRSPAKLTRPTFDELYDHDKLMFNVLGDLTGTIDSQRLVHNHSLIACVLWHDLYGVENKSILSSVKKFSRLSRTKMEELSKTVDLRYLLGVMNSKYASVLLRNLRGGDYHIYPEHIRNIPIPTASLEKQKKIAGLVDRILAMKKNDPETDTSALESEIDTLVYCLYGLSDTEIAQIENHDKHKARGKNKD